MIKSTSLPHIREGAWKGLAEGHNQGCITLGLREVTVEVIEAYKIIMQKYDQDCTTGNFKMMDDEITRGNT